jgi:hypothetical protein
MLAADDHEPVENNGAVPDEISREVNPRVKDALSKWMTDTGTTLDFDQWITPGLSGALLATVVLNSPGRAAHGVLMKVCPPGRMTGKEAERHAEALVAAPNFADHLVTQPVPPVTGKGGWVVMFQDVAGGSLRTIRPLSTMRSDLPKTTATIVRSILSDWNPTARTTKQKPVPFFREHLGTRSEKGGPLDQFAQKIMYTPSTGTALPLWVRVGTGDVVPNAVAWARSDAWLEDLGTEHLMVVVGCAHGDLHADNVLVPQKPFPDPLSYRLIDLAAYNSNAPLARDPSHLLLSILVNEVAELTEIKRQAVSEFLIDPSSSGSEHLLVAGVLSLAKSIREVGEGFASELGLLDHWQDQTLVSLAANALLFAIRLTDPSMQQWCLELSCTALGRFCARRDVASPAQAPLARITGTQGPIAVDTARALEDLAAACDDWAATRTTILVLDSSGLTPEARAKISALHWKVVVDLNPSTNVDGGWACAACVPGDRRLFTNDQTPFFGRSSTVWLAGAGLSDADQVGPDQDLRRWRQKHFRFISNAINTVAQVSSHPATVVCMGEPRSAERAVVEACVDALGERVRVVVVAASDYGVLSEYGADTIRCDPSNLLQVVPDKPAAVNATRAATLPGHDGRVPLSPDLVSRYADSMDLLHSEVGAMGQRDVEPGAFYKGRPITWYELDLELDVDRRSTSELVNDVLRPSLTQRNTLRVMLTHTPGAGGTTMARRAAWNLKDEHPTVYVRGDVDESVFVQAVSELAQLCDTSVLVVVELVPGVTVRNVFEALRANTVPVVLLITTRRSVASPGAETDTETSSETDRRHRSVHVGSLGRSQERLEMAHRFADLAPQRSAELLELAARPSDNNVPFFYALTAFGADFEGLQGYVAQFLVDLSEQEREIIILISMCHRFCGVPVPAELFAELLDLPPSAEVDLTKEIAPALRDLLIEDPERAWRSTHSLIAEEVLKQVLSPAEGTPGREDWKASLPGWCLRLIDEAATIFGRRLPADMKSIIDRLFTVRESREFVEIEGVSNRYTDLMQALSSPGRLQILKALVSAFPEEPHYWAHLGRLLSYDAGDFAAALAAADRAIALSPKDPLLHHMRGMVFRNEMQTRIHAHTHDDVAQREGQVLDLCQSAGDAFRRVSELNDATEYGHIALAQANIEVIEYGYGLSASTKYAQFLALPTVSRYRDLLADAEESLEAAREIRGSDRASYVAETTEIRLRSLYDDYSALLQGWRSLLDRADLAKPPIRRRLARAYRNRAGSWCKASPRDVQRAVGLLEENLLDNPRDARSLLEWLRAARFANASLDQAADLVAGWARAESSREALFYDYVVSYLLAMDGQNAAVAEYQSKVERCRDRAACFGNRRFAYEWLGRGSGLERLVHHSDLPAWERRSGTPAPPILLRISGRVQSITKPTVGTIDFGHGLHAFVVPSTSGLLRGRDENKRVTAVVGFRYDGPRAFVQKPA